MSRHRVLGLAFLVLVLITIFAIWLFDPFDRCPAEWRVITYDDFTGRVTETCVDQ